VLIFRNPNDDVVVYSSTGRKETYLMKKFLLR